MSIDDAARTGGATGAEITGVARVDRRTKDLAKRIKPGEIAVIDHRDLDTVATESLIEAGVAAVVNADASISGRYPNVGPLLLPAAGVPMVDQVGSEVMDQIVDGTTITIRGHQVLVAGAVVAEGCAQDMDT
ncbi:MAG TPA: hypothetical protein PK748_12800, partial [Acidimicrobiales bacterium]|nr:hypothetical protein [Acidimicrobiales bacterium]